MDKDKDIIEELMQSPYSIALIQFNPTHIEFNREITKGNIRIPEISEIILLRVQDAFKKQVQVDEGKKVEKNFMKLYDKTIKYNLAHSFHTVEDIFQEVSVCKNSQQREIYTLMKSRLIKNVNLI